MSAGLWDWSAPEAGPEYPDAADAADAIDAAGGTETGPEGFDPVGKIGDIAAAAGIRRVEMVAWRDLDHPEAGGSELHAASVAERWAAAGIDVTIVASRPEGQNLPSTRDGYHIERPAGRYHIFAAVAAPRTVERIIRHLPGRLDPPDRRRTDRDRTDRDRTDRNRTDRRLTRSGWPHGATPGGTARRPAPDATVEIWNGMPFFSPLWADRPRLVFLHHVHDRMWDLVLPPILASAGRFIERRLAPPIYRSTPVVTLSDSSRDSIVSELGFDPAKVHVVEPGVDERFVPGRAKSERPLVVACGRLVRYKRFDLLVDTLVELKARHPGLQAVIAGEGAERADLESRVAGHGAAGWLKLPGYVDADELVELYQRAWAVASTSAFEGWGMTISEAAACATPAVVSPITGHTDVVADGITGFLAQPGREMVARLDALLSDPLLRHRMSRAARHRSAQLTWDRTALETMRLLADQVPTRD